MENTIASGFFAAPTTAQACVAESPRGNNVGAAEVHLPGSVANELIEVGWPATATRVVKCRVKPHRTQSQKAFAALLAARKLKSQAHPYFAACVCEACQAKRAKGAA
jgi:hypothetical protein